MKSISEWDEMRICCILLKKGYGRIENGYVVANYGYEHKFRALKRNLIWLVREYGKLPYEYMSESEKEAERIEKEREKVLIRSKNYIH